MGNLIEQLCGCSKQSAQDWVKKLQKTNYDIIHDPEYKRIFQHNRKELVNIFSQAKYSKKTFENVNIQVIPINELYAGELFNLEISKQKIKIILTKTYTQNRSQEQRMRDSKSCIFFSNVLYWGEIQNGKAHGKGKLYFLDSQPQYQVDGFWLCDSLKKGNISKLENNQQNIHSYIQICQLDLFNGERDALIKVKDKFEYKGSIKLQGSKQFNQILTGQGTIKYQNGDVYTGRLLNGVYQTKDAQTATFTYGNSKYLRQFKGCYKNGLREDIGNLSFQIDGHQFNLKLLYKKGVPLKGKYKIDNIAQYRVFYQNQTLRISQEIE